MGRKSPVSDPAQSSELQYLMTTFLEGQEVENGGPRRASISARLSSHSAHLKAQMP